MLGQVAVNNSRLVDFMNNASAFRHVGVFSRGFGSFAARWNVYEGEGLPRCTPGTEPEMFFPTEEQVRSLEGGHPNQRMNILLSMMARKPPTKSADEMVPS